MGTAVATGVSIEASLWFTVGARGLGGLRARPAGRYPIGGRGTSTGGTGSGRSGVVNFAGFA